MDRLCKIGDVVQSRRFGQACARLTRGDLRKSRPGIQLGYQGHNLARDSIRLDDDQAYLVVGVETGRERIMGDEVVSRDWTGGEVEVKPAILTEQGWQPDPDRSTYWFSQYSLTVDLARNCPYYISPTEIELLGSVTQTEE